MSSKANKKTEDKNPDKRNGKNPKAESSEITLQSLIVKDR